MAVPVEFSANDRFDAGRGRRLREFHCAMEIIFVGQRNRRKVVARGQLNDGLGRQRRIEE